MRSSATTVTGYLSSLSEPRKSEIKKLHDLIRKTVPTLKPHILAGMLGYGPYHYKYASGREGDWAVIGLASQKNYISLYVCAVKNGNYIAETYKDDLPKASIGKSCVRFKKIEYVDLKVIEKMLKEAATATKLGEV